jgi:hypothetical protein
LPDTRQPPGPALDLDAYADRIIPPGAVGEITVTKEDPVARDHRLREERRDALVARVKDVTTYVIAVAALLAVGVIAARSALDNDPANLALATWARSIVGGLLGALAGYFLGKRS